MNRKQRQREQRKDKRQLHDHLLLQAKENKGNVTISGCINLDKSFASFAINCKEIQYDDVEHKFCNRPVSEDRQVLINEVIRLKDRLNPTTNEKPVGRPVAERV